MSSQLQLTRPAIISSEPVHHHGDALENGLPSPARRASGYRWNDAVWMRRRGQERPSSSPLSIYRLYPAAWRVNAQGQPLGWKALAVQLVPYVADLGFTHVELKDVSEASTDHGFAAFVDLCHDGGIGVILEWPPAGARYQSDPEPLRHLGSYLEAFHLDGLRLATTRAGKPAEPVFSPKALHSLLDEIAVCYPNILVLSDPGPAEVGADASSSWHTLAWNTAWSYRTLAYLSEPPEARSAHHGMLVTGLSDAFDEHYVLPLADDESSEGRNTWLGRMPGDEWQRFANLRACLGFMWAHPGKKLLGMGTEFAQGRGWRHGGTLDWELFGDAFHMGVFRLVADLNRVYVSEPALHIRDCSPDSFAWVVNDDSRNSVIAFLRYGEEGMAPVLAIVNFTPEVHHEYRLGVPALGVWRELLNTDSEFYGGSNVGNASGARAEQVPSHGYPASLSLTIPPLAMLLLRQGDGPS